MTRDDGEVPARPPRLPVTVVTGFAGAGKSALVERWLRERPAGERWALLGNASTPDAPGAAGRYRVAGGCACCTAQASARSELVALLRAGPWHRLIVELDGTARPEALIDLLHRPPFDALLEVDGVVAVVDAARPAPFETEPMHPLARSQVEVSTHIVLNRAGRLAEPRRTALVHRLAGAPPFGRPVTPAFEAPAPASLPSTAPPLAAVPLAAAPLAAWRRPAGWVHDRARLQALVADWPARHRLAQASGVFRTVRDWYLWRFDGRVSSWEACAYRLENRLQTSFHAQVPARTEAAARAAMAADLEQAVHRDRDEA